MCTIELVGGSGSRLAEKNKNWWRQNSWGSGVSQTIELGSAGWEKDKRSAEGRAKEITMGVIVEVCRKKKASR